MIDTDLFPERLKKARAAKDWTQTKLAERAGVTKRIVVGYEQGARRPSLFNAALLAEALDVNLDWLAGRVKDANAKT